MFFVADQPFLTSDTVKELIKLYKKNKSLIIYPKYGASRGSPVIIPKTYKSLLLNLENEKGGSSLITPTNSKCLSVSNTIEGSDVDTVEDYQKLLMFYEQTLAYME